MRRDGYEVVEMQFSDLQIPCSYCNGMRFKDDILSVKFKIYVSEILTHVEDALGGFSNLPKTR